MVVGKRVAQFIEDLMRKDFLVGGGDRIHLIGFSLGAHVAGLAGQYFGTETKSLIYRITGVCIKIVEITRHRVVLEYCHVAFIFRSGAGTPILPIRQHSGCVSPE